MATLSHDGDLNRCAPLLDSDEVSRYCSPGRVSHRNCKPDTHERCEPNVGAFQTSAKEPDLSVNRLQFFQTDDRAIAIEGVKWEFRVINYELRPNGRFVVFNVGRAFHAVKEKGYDISFMYTPKKPHQPSHSSIYGLPRGTEREDW